MARAAEKMYHKPGGFKNRIMFAHRPGSQKSEMKVWLELVPSEMEGEPGSGVSQPLVVCWKSLLSLKVLTVPGLVNILPGFLPS